MTEKTVTTETVSDSEAETVAAAETVVAAAGAAVALAETNAARAISDRDADISELRVECQNLKTELTEMRANLTSIQTDYPGLVAKMESKMNELSTVLQSLIRQEHQEAEQIAGEVNPENEAEGDHAEQRTPEAEPPKKRRRLI